MAQFLSGHNLDYVYNQIRINVKTKINYNLDDNSQYKNILIPKLSSAVHNKYRNYDITALNEIAISATTDHIIKIKKKKQSQTTTSQPEVQQNVTTSSLYNTINPESFSRTNLNLLDIEDSTTNGYLLESNTSLLDNSISNHELNNNTILDESFPFKNQVNNSDVKELDNSNSEALNETRFSFENVIKKEDNDFFKKLLKNNDDLMVDSQQNQLPKPLKDKDYDSKSDPNLFKLGLTEQTIRNNIKDQSNANLMEGYNPNRPILPETHLDLTKTTLDSTLNLHSEGSTERKPYMVILDVLPKDTSTSNSSLLKNFTKGDKFNNISCTLINTFRTGFKYDIYLEFVALHDIIGPNDLNIENYHSFILKISELKSLNTLSNNNEFIDSLIIPNDTYGTSNLESGISDGIKAFSQIVPATTFTHDADTKTKDTINYDSSTKILTFKTTFDTGSTLALIDGDKLSFTYAGALNDGTYIGTVKTAVTINSNTSESIAFTDGLILEGTTTALSDSATNDTFHFLGKFLGNIGNLRSASAKLTSTVVKLKSNYICSTDASTFRDFTITLKGMKSSNLSSDILEANGSTTRLQIGLFFKPN